ncbi:type II CAAX endopeptidase family protein [Paenibacillus sp. FSL R7-0204]|uniref:CPBP family intramembrane glutamic endopeptidase n=1 Tax=Paenibacillus TaxID=44249 RepID=UPI0003E1F902|nr:MULTISPECIES: type II CAAX endopeptidase family protein [Paenibacillus]ETT44129.1 abortive infection protein [Paenibacillus sp. FSL R7-269]ETT66624.1 abortive infection protein [Paenibacillus sp. FSL R7-277]OMF96317.1 CAAX protease family protein [Paenibacillus sp. FSL R7-0337]OMF97871.1 CAAX protease family protein [Paenibacillus sp. FSL R7-0333]
MKKFKLGDIKIKKADPQQLTDKLLLINLYITQGLTLFIGLIWILLQKRNPIHILNFPDSVHFVYWGLGLAVIMLAVDFLLTHIVPEDSMDDGGINELLFGKRPLWHIVVISAVVAVCEELLFRGAIQHSLGPYWTSILFAVIHVRYLRHWIPTGWVFLSSYGLGLIYIHSGSLWAPILCHFLIDLFSGMVIRYRRVS